MKIKHIKIQGFRGIDELTLDFGAGNMSVLIGVNGVGKSSVIDCLAILLSAYVKRLKKVFGERRLQKSFENDYSVGSSNTVTIQNVSGSTINYYVAGDSLGGQHSRKLKSKIDDVKNNCDSSTLEILVNYDQEDFGWIESIDRGGDTISQKSDEIGLVNLVNKIIPSYSLDFSIPLVLCYPVNRAVLDVSLDLSDISSFTQLKAFDDSLSGAHAGFDEFFRWFRSLEDLENEERRDFPGYRDHRLEAVRKALPKFLPDFANLRVRRAPLRMTVFKQEEELIIDQLSDGEKCLLAMVSDLARRLAIANPQLSDPLQGAGIILIDEIELHLHPQWQRGILPKMISTFPNCQFIVSTHSPQIVSDVKSDAIYVLQKTPQGLVAHHPVGSYGRDSNQILELIMAVSERPQWSNDALRQLFRLIEDGDLDGARQVKIELEQQMGADEPDVMKAGAMIRRRELLGK
jgi:predicted ATP-binding protein involved in virulence